MGFDRLRHVLRRLGCGCVDGCPLREGVGGERRFVATVVRAAGDMPSQAMRQMWSPRITLPRSMCGLLLLWLLDHWSYACHTESPVATRRRSSIDAETSEDPPVSAAGDDLFTAQESINLLCQRLACWSAASDVEPVDVLVTICASEVGEGAQTHSVRELQERSSGPFGLRVVPVVQGHCHSKLCPQHIQRAGREESCPIVVPLPAVLVQCCRRKQSVKTNYDSIALSVCGELAYVVAVEEGASEVVVARVNHLRAMLLRLLPASAVMVTSRCT